MTMPSLVLCREVIGELREIPDNVAGHGRTPRRIQRVARVLRGPHLRIGDSAAMLRSSRRKRVWRG